MSDTIEKLRVDKWLWHARFFKTRTLAAARVKAGSLRINGNLTQKPSSMVAPQDVLTFALGDHIRVIRIEALGQRRGPAPEAQGLYTDLSPPQPKTQDEQTGNPGFDGKGRPTKKDRRALEDSRARHLE